MDNVGSTLLIEPYGSKRKGSIDAINVVFDESITITDYCEIPVCNPQVVCIGTKSHGIVLVEQDDPALRVNIKLSHYGGQAVLRVLSCTAGVSVLKEGNLLVFLPMGYIYACIAKLRAQEESLDASAPSDLRVFQLEGLTVKNHILDLVPCVYPADGALLALLEGETLSLCTFQEPQKKKGLFGTVIEFVTAFSKQELVRSGKAILSTYGARATMCSTIIHSTHYIVVVRLLTDLTRVAIDVLEVSTLALIESRVVIISPIKVPSTISLRAGITNESLSIVINGQMLPTYCIPSLEEEAEWEITEEYRNQKIIPLGNTYAVFVPRKDISSSKGNNTKHPNLNYTYRIIYAEKKHLTVLNNTT